MAARLNSNGILLILWSVAVVGAVPTSAAADPIVVDQALSDRPVGGPHLFAMINGCCPFLAQTYTAGLTGTLVGVSVDVFAAVDSAPLQVALRDTYRASWTTGTGTTMSAYFPGPDILASTILDTSNASLDTFLSFTTPVPQVEGSRYAIVVNYPDAVPGTGPGGWSGRVDNKYVRGEMVMGLSSHQWFTPDSTKDLYFRTYVEPIPEPASLLLLGSGLALLGARRRGHVRGPSLQPGGYRDYRGHGHQIRATHDFDRRVPAPIQPHPPRR